MGYRFPLSSDMLRDIARDALRGVGDPLAGEWEEWTGKAFHVRRRLTEDEAEAIGEAIDIRGTPEYEKRIDRMRPMLPPNYSE
jgi:hypothetical protein